MRVISQDRCYSYDFDRTMFWKQDGVICAHIAGDTRDRVIGSYKSSERAAEVFEDMHKTYSGMPILFQNVEISEDLSEKLGDWETNCIITRLPGENPKIEQIENSVYYMPEV